MAVVRIALGMLQCPQCGQHLLYHDRPGPPTWATRIACTKCTLAWRVDVPTIDAVAIPYPEDAD
jgi:uncharacterized protein YbaR (Trm112 family)